MRYPGRLELEDKGTALVLHYRTAPEREAEAKALMRAASQAAAISSSWRRERR